MKAGGLPPPTSEQDFNSDPRTWDDFERSTLVDGQVVSDELLKPAAATADPPGFVRPQSEFDNVVLPGSTAETNRPEFAAEAGRYHIFASGVCPWASSVAAVRWLLGLQDVVSIDIADGQSGAGWCYLAGCTVSPWSGVSAHAALFCVFACVSPKLK